MKRELTTLTCPCGTTWDPDAEVSPGEPDLCVDCWEVERDVMRERHEEWWAA